MAEVPTVCHPYAPCGNLSFKVLYPPRRKRGSLPNFTYRNGYLAGSQVSQGVSSALQCLDPFICILPRVLTLQDLMAGLLLAESLFSVEQLKPWWRLWSYPIPAFQYHGKLPSLPHPIMPPPPLPANHSVTSVPCEFCSKM